MSLFLDRFMAFKPAPLLAAMLSAALLSGCGDDKKEEPRVERAVVVKAFGKKVADAEDGELKRNAPWQRPGVAITHVEAKGDQIELIECNEDPPDGTVLGSTIDGTCLITNTNNQKICAVSAEYSQYQTVLGKFQVIFVNNSLNKTQLMKVEGLGVNVIIKNSNDAQVFNFETDNLDYQDWLEEIANLRTADTGNVCAGETLRVASRGGSLPTLALFAPPGETFNFDFTPANSEGFAFEFMWDGKDLLGNDVPAGVYTAQFDVKVTDRATGMEWEDPAPVTFEIRNP